MNARQPETTPDWQRLNVIIANHAPMGRTLWAGVQISAREKGASIQFSYTAGTVMDPADVEGKTFRPFFHLPDPHLSTYLDLFRRASSEAHKSLAHRA